MKLQRTEKEQVWKQNQLCTSNDKWTFWCRGQSNFDSNIENEKKNNIDFIRTTYHSSKSAESWSEKTFIWSYVVLNERRLFEIMSFWMKGMKILKFWINKISSNVVKKMNIPLLQEYYHGLEYKNNLENDIDFIIFIYICVTASSLAWLS